MIKFIQSLFIMCIQDVKQMNEQTFPYSQFKFMHQINNEHLKIVEAQWGELVQKCILHRYHKHHTTINWSPQLNFVGTNDSCPSNLLTALLSTANPQLYMTSLVVSIKWWWLLVTAWANVTCFLWSKMVPTWCASKRGIKHLGQGCFPLLWMLARSTLTGFNHWAVPAPTLDKLKTYFSG